jgi:enediyne core biosynthesis thioesterase
MRPYEYRHVVSLEETNVVGNVYFANYVRWQGRCREMFLRDHAPDVLEGLSSGLSLVTVRCSCEYILELFAFDEVLIRMWLTDRTQNRLKASFEYLRTKETEPEMVAKGEQELVCMRRDGQGLHPAPLPRSLDRALNLYSG